MLTEAEIKAYTVDIPNDIQAAQRASGCASVNGSVTPDAMIVAFVQGAQWWEYHKTGATMWASDRDQAEGEAEKRASNGTLGKSPNDAGQRPAP